MGEMQAPYLLALCTCPDRACAESLAASLVGARLAACVNVLEGLTSFYEWEGRVHNDPEVLLIIKTRGDRFDDLKEEICRLHPYELPEVVAVALHAGLDPYLRWIDECLKRP